MYGGGLVCARFYRSDHLFQLVLILADGNCSFQCDIFCPFLGMQLRRSAIHSIFRAKAMQILTGRMALQNDTSDAVYRLLTRGVKG